MATTASISYLSISGEDTSGKVLQIVVGGIIVLIFVITICQVTIGRATLSPEVQKAQMEFSEARPRFESSVPAGRIIFGNECVAEVERLTLQKTLYHAHGHWLPDDIIDGRESFQVGVAREFGGRFVKISGFDCVLVEPMGKLLSPSDYQTTGLVVGLGKEDDRAVWSEVLTKTGLLDSGFSFLIPILQSDRNVLAEIPGLIRAAEYFTDTANSVIMLRDMSMFAAVDLAALKLSDQIPSMCGIVLLCSLAETCSLCQMTPTMHFARVDIRILWYIKVVILVRRVQEPGMMMLAATVGPEDSTSSVLPPLVYRLMEELPTVAVQGLPQSAGDEVGDIVSMYLVAERESGFIMIAQELHRWLNSGLALD